MQEESTNNSTNNISASSGITSDKHLLNEARLLFKKINHLTMCYRAVDVHDEVFRQVKRLENYISQAREPKTRYYIYKAADLYCVIYKQPADRVPYLHMMMDIIDNQHTDLPDREKALTMFKFGDVLYDENKIEETHQFVYNLYVQQPGLFKNLLSGYHLLIESAILLKKYDLAESILDKEFSKLIEANHKPYSTFALFNYVKLYMHKGDYDKALAYLIETIKGDNQVFNSGQEVEMHLYENMCFFLSGDIEYAQELVNTNLLLCKSKGMTKRNPYIKQMFDCIEAAVNLRLNNIPLSKEIRDTLNHFQKGTYAIFGKLLMRMVTDNN